MIHTIEQPKQCEWCLRDQGFQHFFPQLLYLGVSAEGHVAAQQPKLEMKEKPNQLTNLFTALCLKSPCSGLAAAGSSWAMSRSEQKPWHMRAMAKTTGGSDFHGSGDFGIISIFSA